MHFSQGWVQFGYRFSNDAAPFALRPGRARLRAAGRCAIDGACRSAMGLVVAVDRDQPWGVAWGRCWDGERPGALAACRSLVGLDRRSRRAWLTLLPGLAFWDTAEFQAVGPLMGTAHPTGFPTYVLLGWFASVVLQPFGEPAFRMNLLSAICVAVAAGVTVDLVRRLTGRSSLGDRGRDRAGPHADRLGDRRPTPRRTRLHLALVAVLLRLLVAWERVAPERRRRRRTADRQPATGRPLPHRGRRGLRAGRSGNHSLTLLLALAGRAVRARGRSRDLAAPAARRRVRRASWRLTVVLVYLELPLRAGPFRAPLVYGTPETWDGFWYIVAGRAVPRQPHRSVRRPAAQGRRPRSTRTVGPVRTRSRCWSRSGSSRPRSAGRAMRC